MYAYNGEQFIRSTEVIFEPKDNILDLKTTNKNPPKRFKNFVHLIGS